MSMISSAFPDDLDLDLDLDLDSITVVPQKQKKTTPRLKTCYFAGKISKNDWRQELVSDLRGHSWSDGVIFCNTYVYVGPFFVSCDHGCNHVPASHGAAAGFGHDESPYSPQDVIDNNMAALSNADLVLAYITAADCYGTLMELGWALAKGKRVVMAFAPDFDSREFWYITGQCAAVHHNVRVCCLPGLIEAELCHLNDVRGA